MTHSFFFVASNDFEAVVNVAASSRRRIDRFLGSMVERGWTVSKTDADSYRTFPGGDSFTRVLDNIEATYKVRDGVLEEM